MKKSVKLDSTGTLCSIYLMRNVKNSGEIKNKLMKGEIDATIVNASLVPDALQVLVAANKAVHSDSLGKKITRTIHTEVLYNLSPSRKVTQCLKTFGIDDNITDLLVIVFNDEDENKFRQLQDFIQGEVVDLCELDELVDWKQLGQMHGVSGQPQMITDLAISRSSCKDLLF